MDLPSTPYFLCFHYFGSATVHFHFFTSYTTHGLLFLSFRAPLSPFTSSRSICLSHGPVIHYSCHLGLMGFQSVCQLLSISVVELLLPTWASKMALNNVWFFAATLVEEKNTLEWRVGLICFGFDFFMGFWGLEVESGTAFGESKKRKGRRRSSVAEAKLNQVLWTQFLDVWTRVCLTRILCLCGQIFTSVAAWCWNQVQ